MAIFGLSWLALADHLREGERDMSTDELSVDVCRREERLSLQIFLALAHVTYCESWSP
jgi:hypothetical protein